MNRTLLIVRHGKSDWSAGAPTDFSRPLAPRGRQAVPKMGRWLHRQGIRPDFIVSSAAVRARQTILTLVPYLDFPETEVVWDERLYLADLPTLLQVLAECPPELSTTLLAGHNPGLEDLLVYLGGSKCPGPEAGAFFPTAAVGVITLPEQWRELQQNSALTCDIRRPREL